MSELHDQLAGWVVGGAEGEPARDVAIHASGCEACLSLAASVDALHRIDVGEAPTPPIVAARPERGLAGPRLLVRAGAGVVAVVVLLLAVVVGAAAIRGLPTASPVAGGPELPSGAATTFRQEVLGGAGGSSAGPSHAEPTADASATGREPTPGPTPAPPRPAATPIPQPPAGTPRPVTPLPTASSAPPTPAPTVSATPAPTPSVPLPTRPPWTPRPTPTPTPTPLLPTPLPSVPLP